MNLEDELEKAIYKKNLKKIKKLVLKGAAVNSKNYYGNPMLSIACRDNNEKIVELLIKSGANLENKSKSGNTALMVAARRGLIKIVKILIKHGADVNSTNKYKKTILEKAIVDLKKSGNGVKIAEILIAAGAKLDNINELFMASCRNGNLDLVKKFYNMGAKLTYKGFGGNGLHLAENVKVAKFLIEKGADVNKRDGYSQTPLLRAAYGAKIDIIEILLKNGAKMNVQDNKGKNSIMHALIYGHGQGKNLKTIKFLIKNGADVNHQDNHGNTAIINSCMHSWSSPETYREIIETLIDAGGDVDVKNKIRENALMISCRKKSVSPKIVKLLIKHSKKLNQKDVKKCIGHAKTNKRSKKIIKWLLDLVK